MKPLVENDPRMEAVCGRIREALQLTNPHVYKFAGAESKHRILATFRKEGEVSHICLHDGFCESDWDSQMRTLIHEHLHNFLHDEPTVECLSGLLQSLLDWELRVVATVKEKTVARLFDRGYPSPMTFLMLLIVNAVSTYQFTERFIQIRDGFVTGPFKIAIMFTWIAVTTWAMCLLFHWAKRREV